VERKQERAQLAREVVGRTGAMILAVIAALFWCERLALAEELLIRGMGRTPGWVVATADGEIQFRDCRGQIIELRDGRIDRTTQRCPSTGENVTVTGLVISFDASTQVLVVESQGGKTFGFFVGGLADRSVLDDLAPGVPVEVSGPFPGRASALLMR
jgi:hypothetical protein